MGPGRAGTTPNYTTVTEPDGANRTITWTVMTSGRMHAQVYIVCFE